MCLDEVCDQACDAVGPEVTARLQTRHLGAAVATEIVLYSQVCGQTAPVFVRFLAQLTEHTALYHHHVLTGQVTGWIAVVTLLSASEYYMAHFFYHLLKFNGRFSLDAWLLTKIYAIHLTPGGWLEASSVLHFCSTSSSHSTSQENNIIIFRKTEQKKNVIYFSRDCRVKLLVWWGCVT